VRRRVAIIVAIVFAGLGALALRVVLEGRAALAEGDEALAGKRPGDAIAAWESAARWYLPGAPHVGEAYDRLLEFARQRHSMTAWRAVRSAALATRSLWTPHTGELAEADAAIAELAADDFEGSLASGEDRAKRLAFHQAQLARDPRPSRPAAALAVAGIVCWLAGIGVLIRRGVADGHASGASSEPRSGEVDDAGKLVRRRAVVGLAIVVGGVLAWAVGLYSA